MSEHYMIRWFNPGSAVEEYKDNKVFNSIDEAATYINNYCDGRGDIIPCDVTPHPEYSDMIVKVVDFTLKG